MGFDAARTLILMLGVLLLGACLAPGPRPAFTVAEVARLLGVTRQTIGSHVRDLRIPSYRVGRKVMIPREELQEVYPHLTDERIATILNGY